MTILYVSFLIELIFKRGATKNSSVGFYGGIHATGFFLGYRQTKTLN